MGTNNLKIQSVIESAFTSALDKLSKSKVVATISDLYVQLDCETGDLLIYDDSETQIEKTIIFDWIGKKQPENTFIKQASAIIKAALANLTSKEAFEQTFILKPFSVNLTDDEFTVIEELLFIDDELLRLDDPLLKDLDADLDDFLNKLLSDVE